MINSQDRYLSHQTGNIFAGKIVAAMAFVMSALLLSGCVGGTTYGTGVTQEEQLLKDLEGMTKIGGLVRKAPIQYSARPDLVVPAQSAALPDPLEQESSASNVAWPESPEQKLARIRAEADEVDPLTGTTPLAEQKRRKNTIRIAKTNPVVLDPDKEALKVGNSYTDGTYKKRQALRAKYAYSKGPNRKYLTEPPVLYRTPLETAPTGEEAIILEEEKEIADKKAAEELERKKRWGALAKEDCDDTDPANLCP